MDFHVKACGTSKDHLTLDDIKCSSSASSSLRIHYLPPYNRPVLRALTIPLNYLSGF